MGLKTKSCLSWFGSDSEVAAELAAKLDGCDHVTIPFVGGASILPFLKARSIVANDLNELAINFYRIATTNCEQLTKWCFETLSHPDELIYASKLIERVVPSEYSPLECAWAYWAICWLSRKGFGGTDKRPTSVSVRYSPDGGTNATRIQTAAKDLKAWAEHFKRCEWTCEDFRTVLAKVHDKPNCGIYLDPPWVQAGDAYLHKFTPEDHRDLRLALERFENAVFVLRYDDCPLVRNIYSEDKFVIESASARNQANKQTKEVWITRRAKA